MWQSSFFFSYQENPPGLETRAVFPLSFPLLCLSFVLLKPTVAVELKCAAAKGIQYFSVFVQGGGACSLTLCQSGKEALIVKRQGRRESSLVQKELWALAQSPELNRIGTKLISMGSITF